ncbi:hypothetical protein [Rhizobium leguminosarum]|uniref:hypothetical protein n=1 Tax=Rhizobium leguminosarum TaxID=384 RepID=UPI0012DB4A21|nr:hypothetical protein [Rhizobium leguminosarum]
MKWTTSEALVEASQKAIERLAKEKRADLDVIGTARFEKATALELIGRLDDARGAYATVCQDSGNSKDTPLCGLAQLRGMLLDTEKDELIKFATNAVKASGIDPDAVDEIQADRLLANATGPYSREFRLESAAALAFITRDDDLDRATKLALVVLANVEKGDIIARNDITSSAHVIDHLIGTSPGTWEDKPDGFKDVEYADRVYEVSKKLFGSDNARNYDALDELETVLWNSRFDAMQKEVDHTDDAIDGDPLAGLAIGESTASIDMRISELLKSLHDLINRDPNFNRRERHLADLSLSASVADGQGEFAKQILFERDALIVDAVAQGKLPVAVKFESAVAIVEDSIKDGSDTSDAEGKLDDVEKDVRKLSEDSAQLPRAFLALASARRTLADSNADIAKDQLDRALILIGRAEELAADRSEEESGVGFPDLFSERRSIEDEIEKLSKQ